jgi:hypothetical protein
MFGSIDQMDADHVRILPYALALLAVFLIYRRFRRNFGRQPLLPVRMGIRIVILLTLGCVLLPRALQSSSFLLAEIVGIAAGVALGMWGSAHTRYQSYNGRMHYSPHTVTGVAVSLLLIGRLVYRLAALYAARSSDGGAPSMQGFDAHSMMSSPITVGMLFTVIGYYVCYYAHVLWRSRRLRPEDLDVPSSPTTVAK